MSQRTGNPLEGMLRDAATYLPGSERWLVIGGAASLALAVLDDHPGADVLWIATDIRHADDLPANHPPGLRLDADAAHRRVAHGSRDVAVLPAPPDRSLARRWLVLALAALRDGGVLLVAGANDQGIRSVIADARKIFGPAVAEDYGNRQRIARFTKLPDSPGPPEPPSWVSEPGIAPGTWREFTATVGGEDTPLVTLPGVFAADRLDAGTGLLLDALPGEILDRRPLGLPGAVLDAGCGIGVLGIAASRIGAARVDLVDANLLAAAAARENVARLGIKAARVFASDVYDAVSGERYDLIVSNPPFHRGKAIDTSMPDRLIADAPRHLNTGGSLLIVANAFLAYGKRMDPVFRRVETVAATRQYHVLRASDPR